MSRPLVIDCFPIHDEMDILECRLTELYDAVDWFVAVEADVTHQDQPKPYYLSDNLDRFAPFKDKLIVVQATGLPTLAQDPDPWARELAQREHIATGLARIGVSPHDVILQSDVDEIPRALHARNARPKGNMISFGMRGHFFAVDWLYPKAWFGTVAANVETLSRLGPARFGHMRTMRNQVECPPHMLDAGWHLSWLGGPDRLVKKVNSFCHPEVEDRIRGGIANDNFYWREGFHVDGERLAPVEVDDSWPKWIVAGNAPASWYRPRQAVA
jgi:hypothetical protein